VISLEIEITAAAKHNEYGKDGVKRKYKAW